MYQQFAAQLGRRTTFASDLDRVGRARFGQRWGGVYARDTMPPVSQTMRAMVVNTDHAPRPDGSGQGVHWLAALDVAGRRMFNDPLGAAGVEQRRALERSHPHPFAEDDAEQRPDQKDCGVRALVALAIGLDCGPEAFMDL